MAFDDLSEDAMAAASGKVAAAALRAARLEATRLLLAGPAPELVMIRWTPWKS